MQACAVTHSLNRHLATEEAEEDICFIQLDCAKELLSGATFTYNKIKYSYQTDVLDNLVGCPKFQSAMIKLHDTDTLDAAVTVKEILDRELHLASKAMAEDRIEDLKADAEAALIEQLHV